MRENPKKSTAEVTEDTEKSRGRVVESATSDFYIFSSFVYFVDSKTLTLLSVSPVSPWLSLLLFLPNTGKPYNPEPRRGTQEEG